MCAWAASAWPAQHGRIGVKVEGGYVPMPDLPGIGFERKADLIAPMRALSD